MQGRLIQHTVSKCKHRFPLLYYIQIKIKITKHIQKSRKMNSHGSEEREGEGKENNREGGGGERRSGAGVADADGDLLAEVAVVADGANEVVGSVGVEGEVGGARRLDGPDYVCCVAVVENGLGYFHHVVGAGPVEYCTTPDKTPLVLEIWNHQLDAL